VQSTVVTVRKMELIHSVQIDQLLEGVERIRLGSLLMLNELMMRGVYVQCHLQAVFDQGRCIIVDFCAGDISILKLSVYLSKLEI
jgi:hypothetical protein